MRKKSKNGTIRRFAHLLSAFRSRAERQRLRHAHRREAMQMERARQIRIAQLEASGRQPEFPDYDEDAALRLALQESVETESARQNSVDNETNGTDGPDGLDGLDGADGTDGELVRDFMAITGVLDAAEARRYIAMSDGNLEMAIRVFEDAFQIDDSAAPVALPASPSASDMAIDSPAPPVRMIDLTSDSPLSRITGIGILSDEDIVEMQAAAAAAAAAAARNNDDDDDESLAAAIALSLNPSTPPARTPSVRAKSELTELMEQQDRDFQAALTKDRERAAAAAAAAVAAATAASTTASTASTADDHKPATTAITPSEVVDNDALLAVPTEPIAGTAGAVTVRFTLPGGARIARRFQPQTSVGELRATVRQEMLRDKVPSFDLMIPMSKTTFADTTQTLSDLGLSGGVAITVIEK
jgi:hypothetical protein